MALRLQLESKRVISAGEYDLIDFRIIQGKTIYYHRASACVIKPNEKHLDVIFELSPDSAKNPFLSIKSKYKIILTGVSFEAESNGSSYKVHLSEVSIEGAVVPVGVGVLSVNKCFNTKIFKIEIDRGAVDAHLESESNGDKDFHVTMYPEHCNKGVVGKLLESFGLLKSSTLTGVIRDKKSEEIIPGSESKSALRH